MQRWLNYAIGLLLAALLLGGAFRTGGDPGPQAAGMGPFVGQRAPEIAGVTPEGTAVRLSDLRGRAVFLNFWASWCGPCRLEMPEMQRLHENLPPNTAILAVNATNSEASPEAVARFLTASGYTFPVMLDPDGERNARYQVMALPTSLFIDPDGVIRKRVAGPMTHGAMVANLQAALAPPGAALPASRPLPGLPEALSLGPLRLNTGLLLVIAGLIVATALGRKARQRLGRNPAAADDIIFSAAVGGFLGSRILAFLQDPSAYLAQPSLLLAQSTTGLTLAGTLLGAAMGAGWELWKHRRGGEPPLHLLDSLSTPLLAGAALAYAPMGGWAATGALALAATVHGFSSRETALPPGRRLLAAILFGATALVVADFARPAASLWGGLTAVQLFWAAVGGLAALGAWWQGRASV